MIGQALITLATNAAVGIVSHLPSFSLGLSHVDVSWFGAILLPVLPLLPVTPMLANLAASLALANVDFLYSAVMGALKLVKGWV